MDTHWFKKRMKECRVTQKDLAEAISRDRSAISRIISGTQALELWQVDSFARLLQTTPQEILSRAGVQMVEPVPVTSVPASEGTSMAAPLAAQDMLALMSEVLVSLMEVVDSGDRPPNNRMADLVQYETRALMLASSDHAERVRLLQHATGLLRTYLDLRKG